MSQIFVARLFAILFGVLGVLLPSFCYLYYRSIAPGLIRSHMPPATRRSVRILLVLAGLESTVCCWAYAVGWYGSSRLINHDVGAHAWSTASWVGFAVALVTFVVFGLTGSKLRSVLRSVQQSGPDGAD